MYFKATINLVIVLLISLLFSFQSYAQKIAIDTGKLEALLKEWNYAHNAKSIESLEKVYAADLLFYTLNLSRREGIEMKKEFFNKNPNTKQRIVNGLVFTPYARNVIKCDFKKEVYLDSEWKTFSSYLLFSQEHNVYKIIGESDNDTDVKLKYTLPLGMPVDVPVRSSASFDVEKVRDTTTAVSHNLPDKKKSPVVLDSAISNVEAVAKQSLNETITIPKVVLYALIGLAVFAVVLVMMYRKKTTATGEFKSSTKVTKNKMSEKYKATLNTFQNFVITLFDPLYFELSYRNADEGELGNPDLKFEYKHKDVDVRLAIKCFYLPSANKDTTIHVDDLNLFVQYCADRNLEPYYILGVGGEADDPKELYFIPLKTITASVIGYDQLKPFRKSGMFYYNSALKALK